MPFFAGKYLPFTIIITIENIWTKSWKQKIEDTLFPYVENDRNIAKCYGNMMDNMTYDQIKKMIWRAYGEFHISGIIKAKIGEVLLNPYNKVLLVSGEHGSGKTHFLREYLQYQISSGCENYIIPIDADELCIELNRNDVDTVLLKFLRRIISDDISSWENISDFFNNRKAATITIVLDDINKLYRENTYAFSSFIASIEDYTRYDFIRWIIAISDYDAYMIESNAEGFINKYCMECESIYGKKEIQLIRGLNMSIYGKINYIGKKILALYGKELIIDPYLATKEKYIGGINIPLYAHFLALNTDQPEVHAYYSSYDNFANAIYATVKKRISSIAKQNNRPLHAIQEIALMAIADEDVFVTSTQISDIMDMDIFNILNQCKLLKYSGYSHDNVLSKDIDALDDSRDYYTELLFELVPDIFWAKKIMATELIKNKDDTRLNYTNLLRIERIQTTLMPCLIHYLNHNNLTEIFDTINGYMMNDGYYQYPLFCADQLSDEFREIIFRSMIQSKRKKLSDDETYALLIYLDRYIPTEQEIRESKIINNQFKLVHKYEAAIADYNQTEIFRVVLKRMLKDIDIHIFSEDILELFNGIQVKMNNVLGEECGAIYFYKLNEIEADIRNILPFLYTYLEKNISRFDPYCKQIKFPFHEMFTRSFLEKYFLSGDTFEQYILFKKQILELEDENKNDEVVLKLRDFFTRCLSCTIGNIFRMRWITFDSFTSIIDDLIGEVPDQFNYRIVIHLITNSIENSSTVSEKLDKRLIPYLKILISNDDFTSWVNHSKHKSIKKFIEYNVGNDERNSYELEKRK